MDLGPAAAHEVCGREVCGREVTAATAAAEEFLAESRPPSHRTQGSNIPFGHLPSLRHVSPNNASIEGVLAVLVGGRWSSLVTVAESRRSKLLQITSPGALTFKNTQ